MSKQKIAAAVVLLPLAFLNSNARAQDAAICMVKPFADSARKGGGVAVQIEQRQESALARRGFVKQNCSDVGDRARKFRRQMCQVAVLKNDQIEAEFAAHYGIRPSEGCPSP